ncbi:MAG: simple sugar transport system ATP-binding protein [Erysipelotrichaceae bacterium]|nr:MAG: simple sugar transport system ATP-binding [Erysipelotrichaceae bacterium]TXT17374.1 MAG: simple sugar transport system ATP-binding protein [Erysipelotrichaceae bacterium]
MDYVIEMLNITKIFPGIVANDKINFQVKKGEIHALLGENGAGKSTLMSVLFGLYHAEEGTIKVEGKEVKIHNPNIAKDLGIGMVHQHFKLVHNFTVLENVVLGVEPIKNGQLYLKDARAKVLEISKKYNLYIEPDAIIQDITVGMQQRVEILKMLYRENNILIFDEPTAVLTPQEIVELMKIMRNLASEGKSIIFITHKLNEIKAVANRVTILRKGRSIATVDVKSTSVEELSEMMVGRKVIFNIEKQAQNLGKPILEVKDLVVKSNRHHKNAINHVGFKVHRGEILCVAGIEGNGQTDLVYALTGLTKVESGTITYKGKDITHQKVRTRSIDGISHIPEDRHKHGLVLDYTLAENLILQTYFKEEFQSHGFLKFDNITNHADALIKQFDIRSGEGAESSTRSMSGGNQQKTIIAREIDKDPDLLIAVQPTRGLDVGAIEYIHNQLIKQRDNGKAVLLISLELNEVMNISDRIIVIYEGEIVGEVDPKTVTEQELGLYMAGSKRENVS